MVKTATKDSKMLTGNSRFGQLGDMILVNWATVIPPRKLLVNSSPLTTTALHLGRQLRGNKHTSKKHCETTTTPSHASGKHETATICRCPSVCLSVVCRLSVTFVHPTQAIEIFGNVSAPFNTLVISLFTTRQWFHNQCTK